MPESFFDFRARVTKPQATADTDEARLARAISVAELTGRIDAAIKSGLPAALLVKGEISNLNIHRASGHIYFTLKDDKSSIDCVMFRGDAEKLKVTPHDGDEVLATGSVRVYTQRGRYQLYVTQLTPVGRGALEAKFQILKEKLEREGLFDPVRKRELPAYPQRIALVTSKQAAALQDMLKVFARYPWVRLRLCHVPVQGDGSAEKIAAMLGELSRAAAVDLVILARGGGSLEDLWEFNEEIVARAIVASRIPIITGIGHEVDVAIADLAADYHAHTPTEAAQVAIAQWKLASAFVDTAAQRLSRSVRQVISSASQKLQSIERHELFRRPTDRIDRARQLMDDRERQLRSSLRALADRARRRLSTGESRLQAHHPRATVAILRQRILTLATLIERAEQSSLRTRSQRVDTLEKQLAALNPTGVLSRGYSITSLKKGGQIVRDAAQVKSGDVLITQFNDGTVESVARDPKQPELF